MIAIVVIAAVLIMGVFVYLDLNGGNSANGTVTQTTVAQIGTQSNPYQPNQNNTLEWHGPGYYSVPSNVPASGLNKGTDYLSSQNQVSSYNQWAYHPPANTTTTSTVNTTSVSTTSTTTISQAASDASWVAQFFQNVSSERGSQYGYCPSLSQFAKVRFSTMAANYGISHYGYDKDFSSYYGTIYNTYFGEEVFYPNLGPFGDTPYGYTGYIQSQAPGHWQLITSSNYSYYGYDIQNGPTYSIYGPDGGYALCPVTEIPGPNINITQFYAQYGCSVVVTNDTWFVIELASSCP